MRSQYLVALAGAFILGLPALPAFAQGSVLVPQDYAPSPQTTDESGNPVQAPEPGYQPNLPKLDPGQIDTGSSATSQMSPIPTNNNSTNHFDTGMPTQVLKMDSSEASSIPGEDILPENVKVTFKDYLWGPQDVDAVNQSLHIARDQVPKLCHVSLIGMLNSDSIQSGYTFDLGSTLSSAMIYYEGKASSVNIMVRAFCDRVPLPPNSGAIMQVGDKYSVFLNDTICSPPASNGQTLTFKYAGNGNGSCVYK